MGERDSSCGSKTSKAWARCVEPGFGGELTSGNVVVGGIVSGIGFSDLSFRAHLSEARLEFFTLLREIHASSNAVLESAAQSSPGSEPLIPMVQCSVMPHMPKLELSSSLPQAYRDVYGPKRSQRSHRDASRSEEFPVGYFGYGCRHGRSNTGAAPPHKCEYVSRTGRQSQIENDCSSKQRETSERCLVCGRF
jgi:hypothetical protein